MTERTKTRMKEIRARTRRKRRRYTRQVITGLSAAIFLLAAGMLEVLRDIQSPGNAAVAGAYGSVLLREWAEPYIAVGVIAFSAGVLVAVLLYRLRRKRWEMQKKEDSKEEVHDEKTIMR